MKKTTALFAAAIAFSPASAQMVIQADAAMLQPQIRRDDTGFRSCGVRAIVMTKTADYAEVYDFSAVIDARMPAGMLKAGKTRTPHSEVKKGNAKAAKVVIPAPVKFWIAKEAEGKAITPAKFLEAESKGFVLSTADLVPTLDGILAMLSGERMHFSMEYRNEPVSTIVGFSAKLNESEANSLISCLEAVMSRMKGGQ